MRARVVRPHRAAHLRRDVDSGTAVALCANICETTDMGTGRLVAVPAKHPFSQAPNRHKMAGFQLPLLSKRGLGPSWSGRCPSKRHIKARRSVFAFPPRVRRCIVNRARVTWRAPFQKNGGETSGAPALLMSAWKPRSKRHLGNTATRHKLREVAIGRKMAVGANRRPSLCVEDIVRLDRLD
jgi:hypothetical protein